MELRNISSMLGYASPLVSVIYSVNKAKGKLLKIKSLQLNSSIATGTWTRNGTRTRTRTEIGTWTGTGIRIWAVTVTEFG